MLFYIFTFFPFLSFFFFFFFNDTATTEIYTLSLHDALPISRPPTARSSACPRPASARASSTAPAATHRRAVVAGRRQTTSTPAALRTSRPRQRRAKVAAAACPSHRRTRPSSRSEHPGSKRRDGFGNAIGGRRLRLAGAGSDRGVLLAGALAPDGRTLGVELQRGRLGHGRLLRRLHCRRAGARHADRSGRSEDHLSTRSLADGCRPRSVRPNGGRVLVGLRRAVFDRHRLGRDLYDRS